MNHKALIQVLGFNPRENTSGIFLKQYNGYTIEIDFEKKQINFGDSIKAESKTTQNFSQPENWIVLECVDRLLEKGYPAQNITLEKTWKTGHGTSGRLDVLVSKDNGDAYLMIECKTWDREFDRELKSIEKNGGQLFTYFQQDDKAEVLMLYTSKLNGDKIEYRNEIIKIEEHYRQAGNVEDVFNRWNKITNVSGIFESWVNPYLFENKKLIKKDLKPLTEEDSQKVFYQFLSILRKHSVSDKPNAFNKIFNLFLSKIFDEKKRDDKELDFQWKEHKDNAVDFQIRLINLYKSGMLDFLQKEVKGITDDMFSYKNQQELEEKKKHILLFNKVFDIKDVFDDDTFEDNQRVLKDVVQLLQGYQIRYPRKQRHLSDFFERLLTTGLKQEAGQYFTPPPITRFIIRCLPICQYIKKSLNEPIPKLPAVIDYSVGSGHFLTEVMEEYQRVIEQDINADKLETDEAEDNVKSWKIKKYDWASRYIYGIEKDYRLVKVAKVGCYFYGDGLAQVILGDGLDNFEHSKNYRGLLKNNAKKPQFSFVVSNPPYSVSSFKGDLKNIYAKEDFELFDRLTDNSSEIECLFVERTKHLLKTDGIAAIILPSSILSNSGIYTQTREIILKSFDIVAITELGSNTFDATGTNTIILFLKRREDQIHRNIKKSLAIFFTNLEDITINGIEKPITKYIAHTWEETTFEDYKTLLQKEPNDKIKAHEIFKEYNTKIKSKNTLEKWAKILDLEKEKLLYFILTYNQKIVLVKTGNKKAEKQFLGYEFSNRRGSEGIHPIQRGKTIDDCTQLYDPDNFGNPNKASTYIYKAFTENEFGLTIPENLKENISYQNLVDLLTFDRITFEKNISLSIKKKIKIESKWNTVNIGQVIFEQPKSKVKVGAAKDSLNGNYPFFTSGEKILKFTDYLVDKENIYLSTGGNALVKYHNGKASYSTDTFAIRSKSETKIKTKFIFLLLESIISLINQYYFAGIGLKHLQKPDFRNIKIPLPPLEIQQKIVSQIEVLEKQEEKAVKQIKKFKEDIKEMFKNSVSKANNTFRLSDDNIFDVSIGKRVLRSEIKEEGKIPVYSANVFEPFGYIDKLLINEFNVASVLWGIDGDWMVQYIPKEKPFYPTDHCGVLRVKNNEVNERFLSFILEEKGRNLEFSRNKRASIERIKGIKISLPSISEQQKTVSAIQKIETKITELENQIAQIPEQKELILKKYLQ